MVSAVKLPEGHVLDTTAVSACVWDDYASALIVKNNHGLVTGDYVYIKSNVSNYNGFWYVVRNNGSSFYIREYPAAANVATITETCDVTYQKSVLKHGYQCVHLPIVYKLRSNLWPTNEVDTSRTISSITNDNGLCNLNLSGSLGTFDELEYVKITGNDDFADEVYQIVDKVSSSDITINRAFESGLSTSGTIQLYYNNYTIYVNIRGGLKSTHFWNAQKQNVLLATLKVTPDADNIATINIAEILKDQIFPTENSTLSPYLPNNLDFFTQFSIGYAESYDDAVNGEIVETISSFSIPGNFNDVAGTAINAQLPFKNIHSGYLSAYIYANANNLIKFLTIFNPVFFEGEYFDISFINNLATSIGSGFRLKREVYIDSVLKEVFYDNIGNRSEGLYRKQIERSGWNEDRIDISLQFAFGIRGGVGSESYSNQGAGTSWANGIVTLSGNEFTNSGSSKYIVTPFAIANGVSRTFFISYSITYNAFCTPNAGDDLEGNLYFGYFDDSYNLIDSVLLRTDTNTNPNNLIISATNQPVTLAATGTIAYIGVFTDATFTPAGADCGWSVITTVSNIESLTVESDYATVSETKTITVNSDCSDQDIYLGWLNYLGGFEYWKFTARKDYLFDVDKSQITEKNIYTNWPNSYGEFANSITKQIARESRKSIVVRSQYLTLEQLEGIKFIRFSPLVQIIEDKYNVTNVVVDAGSFRTYTDQDDLYSMEFTIRFTDTIPSQFE